MLRLLKHVPPSLVGVNPSSYNVSNYHSKNEINNEAMKKIYKIYSKTMQSIYEMLLKYFKKI